MDWLTSLAGFLSVLITITLTLPRYDVAADGGCFESASLPTPCDDLDSLFIYEQVRYAQPVRVLAEYVAGMQGLAIARSIPDLDPGGGPLTIFAVTTDFHGNRSCPTVTQYRGTTSVPIVNVAQLHRELFDVAGRRIEKITCPGIVFIRDELGWRKVRVVK